MPSLVVGWGMGGGGVGTSGPHKKWLRASLMHDGVFSVADIECTLMVHRVQLAWGEAVFSVADIGYSWPQALLHEGFPHA